VSDICCYDTPKTLCEPEMSGQALTELHMLTNRRRFIKTAGSMGIGALVPFHLVDDQKHQIEFPRSRMACLLTAY
jgi:hypothetical protein